jgi:prophage maintenance system killer protein
LQLAEPVDFTRTDPETTVAKVRVLSATAVFFNVLTITDFGGHPFYDPNKRTGFLLAIYYLDRVGFALRTNLSWGEVVSFCRRDSAREVRDLQTIAAA